MSAGSATVAVWSTRPYPPHREQRHQRQRESGREKGRVDPDAVDDDRGDHRAEGERRHRQPFLHAEHPCEDVVVDATLEQGARRHVEEALPDPGDPQEQQRRGRAARKGDQGDRQPDHEHAEEERRREPLPADQRDGRGRPDETTDTDGRGEHAGAGGTHRQHAVGQDHGQHVERPDHDGLTGHEAKQEPRPRAAPELAEAFEGIPDRAVVFRHPCARMHRKHQEPNGEHRDGGDGEDELRTVHRDQQPRQERADEDGEPFQGARQRVGGRELRRGLRQLGQDREVGRAGHGDADGGDRREDIHDRIGQRQREGRGDEPRGGADRQIPESERTFPMNPVPQLRHEWRQQRRRDEQGDGRDPHLFGATDAVGEHEDRDPLRGLGRAEDGEGEQRTPQPSILQDRRDVVARFLDAERHARMVAGLPTTCKRDRDAPRAPDTRNGARRPRSWIARCVTGSEVHVAAGHAATAGHRGRLLGLLGDDRPRW